MIRMFVFIRIKFIIDKSSTDFYGLALSISKLGEQSTEYKPIFPHESSLSSSQRYFYEVLGFGDVGQL